MKNKKGQAAMEFLMTYGWAILVVLIVIGALAYFGVLNPQQFLPSKCKLSGGIHCLDKKLDTAGNLQVRLSNGMGNTIHLGDITISDAAEDICTLNLDTRMGAGEEQTFTIPGCTPTGATLVSGERVKWDVSLAFLDTQTNFDHTTTGILMVDVEP